MVYSCKGFVLSGYVCSFKTKVILKKDKYNCVTVIVTDMVPSSGRRQNFWIMFTRILGVDFPFYRFGLGLRLGWELRLDFLLKLGTEILQKR